MRITLELLKRDYPRVRESLIEVTTELGQAESRWEDIPGRRNNQHKESKTGSVGRQACLSVPTC